jgi:ATP/maltotriose-dependent transcriptional regulator MalT
VRAVVLWVACTHPPVLDRGQLRVASREPAGRAAGPDLRAATALARVLTQAPGDQAVTDAEGVLQAARPSGAGTWGAESAVTALFALVYADRLETAGSWCDRLLEESTVDGTPVGRALVTAVRAEVALRRGDLATAVEQGRAALTLLPRAAWGTAVGLPLGCVVAAATRMGRHDTAAEHLAPPVHEATTQSRHGLHYLHARGCHYLATDRHYAALADFLACGELMSGWGMDMPGLVPWRTSAAAAWLHGGNRGEARRLLNEQLARLGPAVSRTRGTALRLLAATGQQRARLPLLTEASSILAETGDKFELAHTLAELSRAHQELRDHRRAWSLARRAWHVANRCHAEALCAQLLPGRTRPEPAATGVAALTDAERRVAALAAVGYTNREIADKLFITPSTIEQHLTRVYRKLEVKYRKDLPATLQSDLAGTP